MSCARPRVPCAVASFLSFTDPSPAFVRVHEPCRARGRGPRVRRRERILRGATARDKRTHHRRARSAESIAREPRDVAAARTRKADTGAAAEARAARSAPTSRSCCRCNRRTMHVRPRRCATGFSPPPKRPARSRRVRVIGHGDGNVARRFRRREVPGRTRRRRPAGARRPSRARCKRPFAAADARAEPARRGRCAAAADLHARARRRKRRARARAANARRQRAERHRDRRRCAADEALRERVRRASGCWPAAARRKASPSMPRRTAFPCCDASSRRPRPMARSSRSTVRAAALARSFVPRLPAYASSLVNQALEPAAARDLEGVMFVDLPWIVTPNHPSLAKLPRRPRENLVLERLYALGLDAFEIARGFTDGVPERLQIAGATGRLTLAEGRHFASRRNARRVPPRARRARGCALIRRSRERRRAGGIARRRVPRIARARHRRAQRAQPLRRDRPDRAGARHRSCSSRCACVARRDSAARLRASRPRSAAASSPRPRPISRRSRARRRAASMRCCSTASIQRASSGCATSRALESLDRIAGHGTRRPHQGAFRRQRAAQDRRGRSARPGHRDRRGDDDRPACSPMAGSSPAATAARPATRSTSPPR